MITVNFLGDSITQGCWASAPEKNYVSLVGKAEGIASRNYGVGGARIAHEIHAEGDAFEPYCFLNRVKDMEPSNLLYVFGGTNDYGHGDVPMGKLGDTDPYTFYGALETLITMIEKKIDLSKVTFILPIPRYGEGETCYERKYPNGCVLEDYRNAIKEEAKAKGIRILDLCSYFPLPTSRQEEGLFKDGLHPNDKGHALLAKLILEDIRKQLGE